MLKGAESGGIVLVPVDLSAQSEAAVVVASELVGSAFDGLLILHVVHEAGDGAGFYRSRDDSGQLTAIPEIAANLLSRFVGQMRRRYPALTALKQARAVTVAGLPCRTIQDVAEREGAGLIVMASRKRSVLGRLLRPSVSERVVRASRSPVVLVTGAPAPNRSLRAPTELHAVS